MADLIDTSLWIDYSRVKSPRALKEFVAPFIWDADAFLAEPVVFEMLRCASEAEKNLLMRSFELMPMLETPRSLWTSAAELGQKCRAQKLTMGALDLLVASVALRHDARVVTFDSDFAKIAEVCALRVHLLARPQ